ncbi:MAG: hypothetical protein COA78_01250 [Blastopirellula sp.]|nr:MAG: hypothetical protein COA78_01250 [Blastopirellula sp.]
MINLTWRLFCTFGFFCFVSTAVAEQPVDFAKDIRSILSRKCFQCHGPDEEHQEAGLRLDDQQIATSELESGLTAIVAGDISESELINRITSDDESEMMPPPEVGERLSDKEVKLFKRWITEGAKFAKHWSFDNPKKSPLPKVSNKKWVRSPIDNYVLSKLEAAGIKPAAEADRTILIRRLSLAITGLPPTLAEVDHFVANESVDAYEQLVDRLLEKNAYGERWARVWLDMARYADSAGYAQDPARTIWKYRDWVIQSLNSNMPYDQFTIEQLAGDMLENPTEDQLIATAFHRNTMTNSEGGTNDEEFRNAALVDRVNTTIAVWMGLTMECAQCHSHKFDPISQEEYFQFFAILNNTEDADRGNEAPTLSNYTPEQLKRQEELKQQVSATTKEIEDYKKSNPAEVKLPEGPLKVKYVRVENMGKGVFLSLAEVQVFAGEENLAIKGTATQITTDFGGPPKLAIDGNTDGDYTTAKSTTHTKAEDNPWWELKLKESTLIDKVVVWNRTDGGVGNRLKDYRVIALDEQRKPVWVHRSKEYPNPSDEYAIPQDAKDLTKEQQQSIASYDNIVSPELEVLTKKLENQKKQLAGIKPITTPIMRELMGDKRRKTQIQIRGNYQIKGDEVSAGVLQNFHEFPADKEPTRLTMAQWIASEKNPLTARVVVNRYWEQLFGIGIVETSEDFGSQGELPSHQELLDYLAVDFVEHGWDVKRLIKQIVVSSTYRQTAEATPHKLEVDSRNRLFSRGPRFRLSAEMIRDQALAVSGLLSKKMLGPSVRPPQPQLGIKAAFGGSTDWQTSPGEDRYRRGLYTSWRRTTPYPSMATFDAPSREVCLIRRVQTNTPLQALVTLNDSVYIEAAQALARRLHAEGGKTLEEQATYAFRLSLARYPSDIERDRLVTLFQAASEHYAAEPEQAMFIATEPLGPLPENMKAVDLASWTLVCNVLMNLDEYLSR